MTAPAITVSSHTIDAPGGTLYYELRGHGPLLVIVGAPMAAAFFGPLADAWADTFTVLTTDPRGIAHSVLDGPDRDELLARADDIRDAFLRVDPATDSGSGPVYRTAG